MRRSFKPYQNEHISVKKAIEKIKNSCKIDPNPKGYPIPTEMKLTKCQAKEQMRQEKQKKRGGGKRKEKVKTVCHFQTQQLSQNFAFFTYPNFAS